MQRLLKLTIFMWPILGMLSCVSGKKFEAANAQIKDLNQIIANNEKVITQLKAENVQYGKEAEDCRKAKEAIALKIENMHKTLDAHGTSLKKIKEKFKVAVGRFENEGATVTIERGLVHVTFEDKFFFKEKSSVIGAKGRESLNTVAEVMRENPGITCIIAGNTSSEPGSEGTSGPGDNWSLSTERANAVIRILHNTYNINPERLTAAGRGEYHPAAGNSTAEGREKNNRVEIIFDPNLSRLIDAMNKNQ